VKRRRAAVTALLAALAIGPFGAACGGPERAETYRDPDHGIVLTYDAAEFAEGTLAASASITAAERAVGGAPMTVVELTSRAPGASATGIRVAVFGSSREVDALGFWRVADQFLDGYLPKARAAVAPGITVGEPFRVTVSGLQGYAALLSLAAPHEPAEGFGLALARDPFVYEVIVLCRAQDRRVLDELTRMVVDLRLGHGPEIATP
jgi:hypothetical protein